MTKENPIKEVMYGTAHFTSAVSAYNYYADYNYTIRDVIEKINDREIFIGRPITHPGQSLVIRDGRYFVVEQSVR